MPTEEVCLFAEDYMHDREDFIADNVVCLKGLKDDQADLYR